MQALRSVERSSSDLTKMAEEKSSGRESESEESSCAILKIMVELGLPALAKVAWKWCACAPVSEKSPESNCRPRMCDLYSSAIPDVSFLEASSSFASDDEGVGDSFIGSGLALPDLDTAESISSFCSDEPLVDLLPAEGPNSPLTSGRYPVFFRAFVTSFEMFRKSLQQRGEVNIDYHFDPSLSYSPSYFVIRSPLLW